MKSAIDFLKTKQVMPAGLHTDCPLWPYLAIYISSVRESIDSVEGISKASHKKIIDGFVHNLAIRLSNCAQHVLTIERGIINSEHKSSLTVKTFNELLFKNPAYLLDVLEAYPELARILHVLTDSFISQSLLLAKRFERDSKVIREFLSLEDSLEITKCEPAEGETHNGNLVVCILSLNEDFKIVYKPRDITLEDKVSSIMRWTALQAGDEYRCWTLPTYIISLGYGWASYVAHTEAESLEDIELYYKRAGFLLGLCTAFTTTDITSDNLIASKSNPVPIDLETTFYNVLNLNEIPKEVRWNCGQTSILPNWTWKGTDGIGVDLSALGGLKQQYVSLNLYQHVEADNGSSQFDRDGVSIFPGANVLYYQSAAVEPWQYENELESGFLRAFDTLSRHRTYILNYIGDLKGLACRYVPRATATYHYALQCSLHPNLLRSTNERKAFLTKILGNDNVPAVGFLPAEIDACMNLDIPFALSQVGSLAFKDPCYGGNGQLDNNTFVDGLTNSRHYISAISKQDNRRRFEIKQLHNTLAAMKSMYKQLDASPLLPTNKDTFIKDRSALFEELEISLAGNTNYLTGIITQELAEEGLWYGFHASPGGYIEYSELGENFYYGLSGILYGMAVRSRFSERDSDQMELLKKLLNVTYARIAIKLENAGTHIGGFHFGLASSIIPTIITMQYLGDPRCPQLLNLFKNYIKKAIKDELWRQYFWGSDLLGGLCGALCVLVKLYELTQDAGFSDLAKLFYSKLTTLIETPCNYQILKFDRSVTTRPDGLLSGLSHGSMGCAYSIFYYYNVIDQTQTLDNLGRDILNWEISEYDKSISNWQDYRRRSPNKMGEYSWSHGLPGNYLILDFLSRRGVVEAKEFLDQYPPSVNLGFTNLINRKQPVNDSLCHGAYGILNIINVLNPDALKDARVLNWSNVKQFSDFDRSKYRTRAADPLGLWIGKTGAILGALALTNSAFEFPFLPHQMDYLK